MNAQHADTAITSSDYTENEDAKFTWKKIVASFCDPTTTLFMDSLNAEMLAHPSLAKFTPKRLLELGIEPDPAMFSNGGRRKGYYKAPGLCRVWLLHCFKMLKWRGEYFVIYVHPETGEVYDGTNVLAHILVHLYFKQCAPPICHRYGEKGELVLSSPRAREIRK